MCGAGVQIRDIPSGAVELKGALIEVSEGSGLKLYLLKKSWSSILPLEVLIRRRTRVWVNPVSIPTAVEAARTFKNARSNRRNPHACTA